MPELGDCCRLVGDLEIDLEGCIISINSSSKAEIVKKCGTALLVGPTVGTVSVTGYAVTPTINDAGIHVGCAGQAGVSIPWVRRYNCDADVLHFISAGEGASFIAGDVGGLAVLNESTGRSYTTINASASNGPASIYMQTEQEDGYGLEYFGQPISFNTNESLVFDNFFMVSVEGGEVAPDLYLQNFSLTTNPGEIPTASYSFVFSITE